MNKQDVLKIHAEEKARVLAGIPVEAATVQALLAEVAGELEMAGSGERRLMLLDKEEALRRRAREKIDVERHAIMGTRTRVHEALQAESEVPHATDDYRTHNPADLDDIQNAQKAHGKALWKEADRLMKEAGLS